MLTSKQSCYNFKAGLASLVVTVTVVFLHIHITDTYIHTYISNLAKSYDYIETES